MEQTKSKIRIVRTFAIPHPDLTPHLAFAHTPQAIENAGALAFGPLSDAIMVEIAPVLVWPKDAIRAR